MPHRSGGVLAPLRRPATIVLQLLFAVASNWLAFLLRFDWDLPADVSEVFWRTLPWLVSLRAAAFVLFRLHEGLWKYASIYDLRAIFGAVFASSLAFFLATFLPFGVDAAEGHAGGIAGDPDQVRRHHDAREFQAPEHEGLLRPVDLGGDRRGVAHPGSQTPLQYYLQNTLHSNDAQWGEWNAIFAVSFIPTYLLFGYLCRKYPLRTLLFWGTAVGVPLMRVPAPIPMAQV